MKVERDKSKEEVIALNAPYAIFNINAIEDEAVTSVMVVVETVVWRLHLPRTYNIVSKCLESVKALLRECRSHCDMYAHE